MDWLVAMAGGFGVGEWLGEGGREIESSGVLHNTIQRSCCLVIRSVYAGDNKKFN
jgi:hypothetical protein